MASLGSPGLTLRQRRRLQKLAKNVRASTSSTPKISSTIDSTETSTKNFSIGAGSCRPVTLHSSTAAAASITAAPPYHPPSTFQTPSPRSSKIVRQHSGRAASPFSPAATTKKNSHRSRGGGETKVGASANASSEPPSENQDNTAVTAASNTNTINQTTDDSTVIPLRCKLVYTGSFGVGYTCSVCNVFREWRKVYSCTGETETPGLGGHFDVGREQKYLHIVDGTRVPSLSPLPPEMVVEILSFLDFRSMCRSESTCPDWYQISHQPQFAENMVNRDRRNMENLGVMKSHIVGSNSPSRGGSMNDRRSPAKNRRGGGGGSGSSSSSGGSSGVSSGGSSRTKKMLSFVEVVHAAVRRARTACRTITLEQETQQRITMYAARDVRQNQIFRTKLGDCSTNWIAFLLDELSRLCKEDEHRQDHPAFLAKLRFIDKELCRRRTGRAAASKQGYVDKLEEMRRVAHLAVRAGRKPRMGEAKIRDLKCNWRK